MRDIPHTDLSSPRYRDNQRFAPRPPSISANLQRIGAASATLKTRDDQVRAIIYRIESELNALALDLSYMLPQPIEERASRNVTGSRVIELSFLCYTRVEGRYGLGLRTLKVLEHRRSMATERPEKLCALVDAAPRLRHRAINYLSALVEGLANEVETAATTLKNQCDYVESLFGELSGGAAAPPPAPRARSSSTSACGELQDAAPRRSTRPLTPRPPRRERNTSPRVVINRVTTPRPPSAR
ncbi:MAG: hypothetical protein ACPHRO_01545 [Nannocystaceae bacterium]